MKNQTLWWIAGVVVILVVGFLVWRGMQTPATINVGDQATTGTDAAQNAALPATTNSDGATADVTADANVGTVSAATITYTDAGYNPANVTIKKGETVHWVNNSTSQDTWPASAVHPTHTIYPEKSANDCLGSSFDACKDLKPGESWDFKFNQVGKWNFHDHLHASKFGSVTVSE